jgi:hypothetical protein
LHDDDDGDRAALCVPPDLVAVIQSQLDCLHPTAQLVVKITSVMEEGKDVASLDFLLGVFPGMLLLLIVSI